MTASFLALQRRPAKPAARWDAGRHRDPPSSGREQRQHDSGRLAWTRADREPEAIRLLFGRSPPLPKPGKLDEVLPRHDSEPGKVSAPWIELEARRTKLATP